jgi:hypothetical protein
LKFAQDETIVVDLPAGLTQLSFARKFASFKMIPEKLKVLDLGQIMAVHKQQTF